MKARAWRLSISGLVALLLFAGLTPAASADTKSNISVQERRLRWLEKRARDKQARVGQIQVSIRALAATIRRTNSELDSLEHRLRRHQDMLVDRLAYRDELRRQTETAATAVYMRGPLSFAAIAMSARTLAEAGDSVHYASVVLSRNRILATQAAKAARDIRILTSQDEVLIRRRATLLREQLGRRDELVRVFADGQRALEEIAAIRAEVIELLGSLRRQLSAELGGTMPYGMWAEAFLRSIGAPVVRGNQIAMVAWQLAEGTLARWNPLATTWRMPGSTPFNGHRVQNYVSMEQGLDATRRTLSRPRHEYEAILSNLRAGADAMTTGRAINASDWCRGCADGQYVIELIPIVAQYYDRYARRRA